MLYSQAEVAKQWVIKSAQKVWQVNVVWWDQCMDTKSVCMFVSVLECQNGMEIVSSL